MADPVLEAILEVQGHDLATDRLRHQLRTLPARAELARREGELAAVEAALAGATAGADQLGRGQRRLEDEIATLEERVAVVDRILYSGTVTVPRELQVRQEEADALRRRQRRLEDEVLDLMEQAEPVAAEVARLGEERMGAAAEVRRLGADVAEAEAAIQAELEVEAPARAEAAARVPGDLLGLYEGLRERLGGVGAARLEQGRCGGCHLSVPAVELDAIRRAPAGSVVRHEECGRILVR